MAGPSFEISEKTRVIVSVSFIILCAAALFGGTWFVATLNSKVETLSQSASENHALLSRLVEDVAGIRGELRQSHKDKQ